MVKPALSFSWNRDWLWGLLLGAATFLAYQPAWNGQPVWDDDANITSPKLRSAEGLVRIWTQPGATQQYYPLLHTVHWAAYHLWGDWTTGYHLLNILLHFISALLLVRILRKLNVPGAWLAGGIFALHPVMVESVAWITELKNTLSGVFFLGSALAFLTYTEERKRRLYVFALGLFIFGLMSKTAIVAFPAAMLAVVWWKRGKLLWKNDIVPMLPFVLAGIVFGLVTLYIELNFVGAAGSEFSFSLIERCLIAGRAIWFYLGKIFWPANLIFIYPRWEVSAVVWWQYLFPGAALLLGGALWAMRGRWRAPAAMFFYFTAMLLPVLGFLNVYGFRYSFVADHWLYAAAIGPMVLAAAGLTRATGIIKEEQRRFFQPAVAGILLLALGILTWKQSGMYANAETLYRTTIRKNPDCCMAYNNLGILLAVMGRTDEAMAHYQKTLEINPNYSDALYNLGLLLGKMGRTDEAMAHYQNALKLNPNDAETHNNLGILLANMGRANEAIAHFQKALEIDPNLAQAHNNLGILQTQVGRSKDAHNK
jgi:tetratricopeptide (TPR) repeat protein